MSEAAYLRHFFVGIVLVLAVQAVFMLGGLAVERGMGVPVTGIPSAIGLTLVLGLSLLLARRSSGYVLLGSFTLAFLAPLILGLAVFFKAIPANVYLTKCSIVYMTALIGIVWAYFSLKIVRGKL